MINLKTFLTHPKPLVREICKLFHDKGQTLIFEIGEKDHNFSVEMALIKGKVIVLLNFIQDNQDFTELRYKIINGVDYTHQSQNFFFSLQEFRKKMELILQKKIKL